MRQAHANAVGGRAFQGKPVLPARLHPQRLTRGHAMAAPGLVRVRSDADRMTQTGNRPGQRVKPRRVDAVVIGKKELHVIILLCMCRAQCNPLTPCRTEGYESFDCAGRFLIEEAPRNCFPGWQRGGVWGNESTNCNKAIYNSRLRQENSLPAHRNECRPARWEGESTCPWRPSYN